MTMVLMVWGLFEYVWGIVFSFFFFFFLEGFRAGTGPRGFWVAFVCKT